ncbi:MAG: hypothetical protein HWE34_08645 [Methylocystaceae bacterium]|nr:hypothetical protein [Methylocystaceae bacterium]
MTQRKMGHVTITSNIKCYRREECNQCTNLKSFPLAIVNEIVKQCWYFHQQGQSC